MKTKKSTIIAATGIVIALVAIIFIVKAFNTKKKDNIIFREYISAYTAGTISSQSSIKVRLAFDYADTNMIGKQVIENYFHFDPAIEGKAFWTDSRTIEFKPNDKLPYGQKYEAEFYLSKILKVPDSLKTMSFDFRVMEQAFNVTIDHIKPYDKNQLQWEKIFGTIKTVDVVNVKDLETILDAYQNDKKLKVVWTQEENNKIHHFQIDSINRTEIKQTVILKWNTEKIGTEKRNDDKIEIPALGDFIVSDIIAYHIPDQYLLIRFSDPLLENQNLEGLIKIEKLSSGSQESNGSTDKLKFFIEDNEIRVYPSTPLTGKIIISIDAVKNSAGKSLPKKETRELLMEGNKPEIRLIGKGNIIPRSNGLIFPFEAVNLKAVDVKIIKIYENNIAQFLQVNDLNGDEEMYRVGQIIRKKTVMLSDSKVSDFARWNRFSLDLADLIKADPGAIYKVILSFRKSYSLYPCNGVTPSIEETVKLKSNEDEDEDENYQINRWGYYGSYYNYYDDDSNGYDWNERENPCNSAYYNNRSVSRNILASDLGLIAKKGNNGSFNFFVTDIVTTNPLSGVDIDIYNFQHQLMASLKTDNNGMAEVTFKKIPYLLVARKDKQRGYLKLNDGSSLSLSMFDVKGEEIQKGIKGFIYGERGVWRPGDTLFLSFILDDKDKSLPVNHPVIFDLMNPQGQVVKHTVSSESVDGFYKFITCTDVNAPTGNWTAKVRVGKVSFTKNIKIETILPNRLKINLDFGTDKLFKESKNSGTLESKWLHGAIAKNLKADVQVTLSESTTKFDKYPNYIFDDPSRNFSSESSTIFTGRLDQNGKTTVKADIRVKDAAPGVLRASFQTRVFEESGAFSIDRFSMPYYPYNSFVGIKTPEGDKFTGMLTTDSDQKINIVSVNANGGMIASTKLKIEVFKVSWRWWWDHSEEGLSNYVNSSYNQPIQSIEAETKNGTYVYNFRINYPDWGRYFIHVTDLESGHSTGQAVYLDWPGWSGRSHDGQTQAVTMLSFSSDKDKYKVGETVKLTIPSGDGGRALVSIETGSKVLETFWVETKKGFTNFTFSANEEMAPNVYVHVTLLQPHSQTVNDLPIRLYGVIPIYIEDPKTHLRPIIEMSASLKPEQKATINVREENGKEMTYTIAMVDEGLLDLTRFKTPDPWNNFFAREALGVKTWDLFDYVIGAYGSKLERILSIGGDGDFDRSKAGKTANRFKPMVKFFGPFHIKQGGVGSHTCMMPQYVGSVRVMVIAGYKGAYGNAEKTVAVKKPLMILATLPRVIGTGETFKLPVEVFAMENNIKNVSLTLTSNGLLTATGKASKSITFRKTGSEIVEFEMKAAAAIGVGTVGITATCGSEVARYNVEIDVRNPNPKVINMVESVIQPGQEWNPALNLPGIKTTNRGIIEVSSVMPMNIEKRLSYLIHYPYGCIEQTTSSGFPQLYLTELMDLSSENKVMIERNVKSTIQRLMTFQLTSGGLAYWPGEPEADDWGTSYAGHFMLEAAAKGYYVQPTFFDNWKKFQKMKANLWSSGGRYYNSDLLQAYRLYTLALAKAPELGAMNRMAEQKNLSVNARWRLAAAFQLAGYQQMAMTLINNQPIDVKTYAEQGYTYGSDVRDEAMILETLTLLNMKTKAFVEAQKISSSLCSQSWMSTQTTAYTLLAMSKFYKNSGNTSDVNYSYSINNNTLKKISTVRYFSQEKLSKSDLEKTTTGKARIKNEGKSIIYAKIILEGIPEKGDTSDAANNIKLDIKYKTPEGKEINPDKIEQGKDFISEVTVINPGLRGNYEQLALTMVFPSGWEIHNSRMNENEKATVQSSPYTYQDIRDDRVYTYFNLPANTSKVFRFQYNASYAGDFYLPTVAVEAMYDNMISARKHGQWVKIRK